MRPAQAVRTTVAQGDQENLNFISGPGMTWPSTGVMTNATCMFAAGALRALFERLRARRMISSSSPQRFFTRETSSSVRFSQWIESRFACMPPGERWSSTATR